MLLIVDIYFSFDIYIGVNHKTFYLIFILFTNVIAVTNIGGVMQYKTSATLGKKGTIHIDNKNMTGAKIMTPITLLRRTCGTGAYNNEWWCVTYKYINNLKPANKKSKAP